MTLETRTLTRPVEVRAGATGRKIGGEVWRPVRENDCYEVSSSGRVRRTVTSSKGHPAGVILRPRMLPTGYARTFADTYVHRLVCSAFHGPAPSPRHEVAHLDGDNRNNRADNLKWSTHAENEADKIRHGTRLRGSAVVGSKLQASDVVEIRAMAGMLPQHAIAKKFGVSQMLVSKIARRMLWGHVA